MSALVLSLNWDYRCALKRLNSYKVQISCLCLPITFQGGINLPPDKDFSIKLGWKAIASSRKHQRFAYVPLGFFMSID